MSNLRYKVKSAIKIIGLTENWGDYFKDYFKLKDQPYMIRFKNGVKYKIRPKTVDRGLLNEIWANQLYTPKGFEIKDNDIIVDIGAHIGVFSIFAAKHAKSGKVYSFEPSEENYNMLFENVKINNQDNVFCINKAVSNNPGKKPLFINTKNTGGHSFFKYEGSEEEYKEGSEIETTSLYQFIKENKINRIDLLKMDCEGAEYEILFNCPDEILKKIDKISMEYHNLDNEKNGLKMKEFLEKKGFQVIIKTKNDTRIYAQRIK